MNRTEESRAIKAMEEKDIMVTNVSDWNLIFNELKDQWSKRGQHSQSIVLTNDDFMQLQYRIGMKVNTKQEILEGDTAEFKEYMEAMKYIVTATKLLDTLKRAKMYFKKTIGTLNPVVVVEVSMDKEEYNQYCSLMEVEADFLGRKNR